MGGDDVDVGVKVDELEGDEYANEGKVVLGAEPAEMQNFVQNDAALDEYEGDESLLLLCPSSGESLHLVETPVAARVLLLDLFNLAYLMSVLVLIRLLHIIIA
jgi:hypothetical protein